MSIIKIIELVTVALSVLGGIGGVIWKLTTYQTRKRNNKNELIVKEYNEFESALVSFRAQMLEMSSEVNDLRNANFKLQGQLHEAQQQIDKTNTRLKSMGDKFAAAAIIAEEMKAKCTCENNLLDKLKKLFLR